jgi:ribosomal protein S18 acetylase RimI-like enzyme
VITLRTVQSEQEIQELATLAHAIWNQHFPLIIGQDQVDYMVEKFQSIPAINQQIHDGYLYYGIEHQGQIVGYLALVPDAQSQKLQLSKFYILEAMRGQGIGKATLELVVEIARQRGYKILWLTVNKYNSGAIDAYKRMGFQIIDSLEMDIGNGFIMDDFRMEIPIPV